MQLTHNGPVAGGRWPVAGGRRRAESRTAPGPGRWRSGLVAPGPRTVQVGSPLGAICT